MTLSLDVPGHLIVYIGAMTLTHAFKWVMWLRNLLKEMGYGYLVTNPTLMLANGDNAQADRWAREV